MEVFAENKALISILLFSSILISLLLTSALPNNEGSNLHSPESDMSKKMDFNVSENCRRMMINGRPEEKADILLVARDYSSDGKMMEDFRYYMDFNQSHRGLFDVYPMNVSMEKFNVWILDAGVGNIKKYEAPEDGRGLIKDARSDWYPKCSFADYKVVMSHDGFGYRAFAVDNEIYIPNVSRKVDRDNGAVALIHEWGHAFGGLKDEYSTENGRDASGKPNCAPTREVAEKWWGEMAENNPNVGYERGCAYTDDNWEPHPGPTIMGDGGLWHYGPVNDRALLEEINNYS